MAKKKSGSIAVPFLVTIFIGLIIVGGAAYGIYRYLGFGKTEAPPEPTPRTGQSVSYDDNHTILLILDEPEQRCSSTFVLMRSIPIKKEIIFIGMPTNMISLINSSQQRLKDTYDRGGANAAVDFVQSAMGITVDRYMKFDSTSFRKVCDIFGGVSYDVNVDIAGFKNDGSNQYMNASQIETFVTYSMFKGGERERSLQSAALLAAMVNQADGKRIADGFDGSFNSIINLVADTTVTSVDYKNHKAAIKNMFQNGSSIAVSITVDGTDAGTDFIPSEGFIKSVVDSYFTDENLGSSSVTPAAPVAEDDSVADNEPDNAERETINAPLEEGVPLEEGETIQVHSDEPSSEAAAEETTAAEESQAEAAPAEEATEAAEQ